MGNTLITAIIGVGKQCLPSRLQRGSIDMVTMVLWRNVTFARLMVQHGLILTTITEW